MIYMVAQESKPLSHIIKSYKNPPLRLDISSFSTQMRNVRPNLYVTHLLLEFVIQVKSTHLIKSCLKNQKKKKIWK